MFQCLEHKYLRKVVVEPSTSIITKGKEGLAGHDDGIVEWCDLYFQLLPYSTIAGNELQRLAHSVGAWTVHIERL